MAIARVSRASIFLSQLVIAAEDAAVARISSQDSSELFAPSDSLCSKRVTLSCPQAQTCESP